MKKLMEFQLIFFGIFVGFSNFSAAFDLLGLPEETETVRTIVEPKLTDDESAEISRIVAALLGSPLGLEFRHIRRIHSEGEAGSLYCGQVSAAAASKGGREFHIFTYTRLTGADTVRLLGSHDLNGMKSGRKTMVWLKRAGCL